MIAKSKDGHLIVGADYVTLIIKHPWFGYYGPETSPDRSLAQGYESTNGVQFTDVRRVNYADGRSALWASLPNGSVLLLDLKIPEGKQGEDLLFRGICERLAKKTMMP